MHKWLAVLFISLTSLAGWAQENDPEMADALRESGKIYVVVIVLVIIFIGLIAYLITTDMRLRKLEKEIKSK